MKNVIENDCLYSVIEAAKILKISKDRAYKLINTGVLPALKIGTTKVRRSTLEHFLQKYEGYDLTDPEHIVALCSHI